MPRLKCLFIGFFITLLPTQFSPSHRPFVVIWNVGQGQWVTVVRPSECVHFDMGGEFAPKILVRRFCGDKANSLYLSHGDFDHMSFASWGRFNLSELCLASLPREKLTLFKSKILAALPKCAKRSWVFEIRTSEVSIYQNANFLSRVYETQAGSTRILIPGDSSTAAEKIWSENLAEKNLRILILGHHGSKTSSSTQLIERLKALGLKMAFASARFKRYHHPHWEVVNRLRHFETPVVSTEHWGNIMIDL